MPTFEEVSERLQSVIRPVLARKEDILKLLNESVGIEDMSFDMVGVVIEEEKITDEFGISSGETTFVEASIEVTDNTHYITEPLSLGAVTFSSLAQQVGGRAGTLTSGPVWAEGQIDGALAFDGANDFVAVPHDATLDLSSAFTLSAWFRAASFGTGLGGYRTIVAKDQTSTTTNYWFGTWQRELVFGFWSGGVWQEVFTTGLNLQSDVWYQAAASFDDSANEVILYLNGTATIKGSITATPPGNIGLLKIGRSAIGEYWDGTLDDVRIYDQVLAPADVTNLFADGDGGGSGYYLDEFPDFTCDGADEYVGSSGTLDWSAFAWLEKGDDGRACGANIRAMDDPDLPDPTGNRLRLQNKNRAPSRQVDLSGFTSATLSFKYRRAGSGAFQILMSGDGGATWGLLATIAAGNDVAYQSASYDVSAYTTATAMIRFLTDGSFSGEVYIDDVRIELSDSSCVGGGGGGGGCDGPFTDTFGAVDYGGGSTNWTTEWQETGEATSASGGDIFISSDVSNYQLVVRDDGQTVWREADLSAATSADLSFDYHRQNLSGSGNYVAVEVSYDGGSNWSELARFTGTATDSSYTSTSYPLNAASLSANTQIRFHTPNSGMGNNNMVWFDNIEISCTP